VRLPLPWNAETSSSASQHGDHTSTKMAAKTMEPSVIDFDKINSRFLMFRQQSGYVVGEDFVNLSWCLLPLAITCWPRGVPYAMNFYRVMLCIAWTMLSQDVCLSVRPFLPCDGILSKWLNMSSNFFSPSGSHTIPGTLVFLYQTVWQYSDGDPLMGALNAGVYEKIAIFDQYLVLSRKWYKTEP